MLKVRKLDMDAGNLYIVVLNEKALKKLSLHPLDRIDVIKKRERLTCIVNVSNRIVGDEEIGLYECVAESLKLETGDEVRIEVQLEPKSVKYIKEKLGGRELTHKEIREIVRDTVNRDLTDVEIAAFITGLELNGMSIKEAEYLSKAMVETSKTLDFGKNVYDKHCLPEDTPVIIRNSGNVKVDDIGHIIDNVFEKNGKYVKYENGAESVNKNLNNIHVLAHDENGFVDFKPVSTIFRAKSPEFLYEMNLLGNRKIKATENHTIFVLKNGKITNLPIKKIKKGDFVLVPCKIKKNKIIKHVSLYNLVYKKRQKKIPEKIKITPEFMRLLGYYVSEGFTNSQGVFLNFGSHENDLIKDSANCIKKVFKINPTVNKPHKTAVRVCIYNQVLSKVFDNILKAGESSLKKQIPSFIFDVEDEMKFEFLKALFKGDGYVRRGYEAVYVTSSKKLSTGLQYLLSILGLSVSISTKNPGEREFTTKNGKHISKTAKSYYIYTQARGIFGGRKKSNVAFVNLLPIKELGKIDTKEIGWVFRRELKRQNYITKQKLARIENYIESNDVKKLIHGHLSVLMVKEVKKIKSTSKYVYDFQVEKFHRFVAGTAPICIHNSIGGIPGKKETLLVVPVVAAAGLTIPKTSSRAISSPAGTADIVETIANVEFGFEEIKRIVDKYKGCMVWGGAVDLAPADDIFVKIEYPLKIDPLFLPSVMSKKKAVNASHVVIDIPTGRGAKIKTFMEANKIAEDFVELGRRLGIHVRCAITHGEQPVGHAIGPALEAREALETLMGKGPGSLVNKALGLSAIIFEMAGKKNPRELAERILKSGRAEKKFRQIIGAQGGNPRLKPKDIAVGLNKFEVRSPRKGRVFWIRNDQIIELARKLGCPRDKGAGILLNKKVGYPVKKNELIFTMYSDNDKRFSHALKFLQHAEPVIIRESASEEMIIDVVPSRKHRYKKSFFFER